MAAKRYSFVFYVAIVVAIAATYAVFKVLESTKASSRVATAPVVVASRDISEGELIDRLALSVAQWPLATIPVGAYGRIDSVAGRVARVAVFSGEPMVPGRLAPEGSEAGLRNKITPGKRAVNISINEVTGIAGMIPVNSRVDIILTTLMSNSVRSSKIFMANMRVLAMATSTQTAADGRPIPATTVTIEVTPEEGEKLMVATQQGALQLMLRGYGDPDSVVTSGATSADVERMLRGAPAVRTPSSRAPTRPSAPRVVSETVTVREQLPAQKAAARPDSSRIEIFRGAKKEELKFQKDSAARRDTIVRK